MSRTDRLVSLIPDQDHPTPLSYDQLDMSTDLGPLRTAELRRVDTPAFGLDALVQSPMFGGYPDRQMSPLQSPPRCLSSPSAPCTPPRSPRVMQQNDIMFTNPARLVGSQYNSAQLHGHIGQSSSLWKSADIASLEDELRQLRCAADAMPDIQPKRIYAQSSPRGASEPSGSPESGWLSTAMRAVAIAHGSEAPVSPRSNFPVEKDLPLPRGIDPSSDTRAGSRVPDSPDQPSEPEVTPQSATASEPHDTKLEIERLKWALHKAHQEIAALKEEKKASEAAHSRDVAALASLLKQVTAEKAKVLNDMAKQATVGQSECSVTTDDMWSLHESEPDSERVASLSQLIVGLSKDSLK